MRTVDPSVWAPLQKPPPNQRFGRAVATGREARLRRSLRITLREYRHHCSLRGTVLLRELHESALDQYMTRIIFCVLFLAGSCTVGYACYRHSLLPTLEVSLPFQEHSISNIHFPAVAVCSYNLLSKQLIQQYAQELVAKDPARYTEEQLVARLVALGALVDHSAPILDIDFMQFLRLADPARGYNVTHLMLTLNRPCSEQLVHCSWRGVTHDCGELFARRPTPLGFCCVFNGRYSPQDLENEPKTLKVVGQDEGLSMVVKRNIDDFAYIRRGSIGSEILIFDGFEYPLLETGAVRSYSALLNVSAYFVLAAREQLTTENVVHLAEERRGCRFREPTAPRTWRSSYAWCLTLCRQDALRALCGCVPFFLVPTNSDFICSLNQIGCLNKYREKLLRYYPPEAEHDLGLLEESADSLFCPQCVPDCTRTRYQIICFTTQLKLDVFNYDRYSAAVYFSQYKDGRKLFSNFFTQNVTLGNTTVVRIFYIDEDQRLFVLGVTERWFDAVTIIGGSVALLLGASLVSGPELVFFLTLRWRKHYRRLQPRRDITNDE